MTGKMTIAGLHRMKQAGEKIVSLTAYDASFAGILDTAGVRSSWSATPWGWRCRAGKIP